MLACSCSSRGWLRGRRERPLRASRAPYLSQSVPQTRLLGERGLTGGFDSWTVLHGEATAKNKSGGSAPPIVLGGAPPAGRERRWPLAGAASSPLSPARRAGSLLSARLAKPWLSPSTEGWAHTWTVRAAPSHRRCPSLPRPPRASSAAAALCLTPAAPLTAEIVSVITNDGRNIVVSNARLLPLARSPAAATPSPYCRRRAASDNKPEPAAAPTVRRGC